MGNEPQGAQPRSVVQILATSGLTDLELLYIADAIFFSENHAKHSDSSPAVREESTRCLDRHLAPQVSARTMEHALKWRHIDSSTGTKVVTSTIDLLA